MRTKHIISAAVLLLLLLFQVSPGKALQQLNSVWPTNWVFPVSGSITGTFCEDYKAKGYSATEDCHTGIDIGVTRASVVAAGSGIVSFVSSSWWYPGIYISIYHGQDASGKSIYTRYAHLESAVVVAGTPVTAGQQIGVSGCPVDGSGTPQCHLHFEASDQGVSFFSGDWRRFRHVEGNGLYNPYDLPTIATPATSLPSVDLAAAQVSGTMTPPEVPKLPVGRGFQPVEIAPTPLFQPTPAEVPLAAPSMSTETAPSDEYLVTIGDKQFTINLGKIRQAFDQEKSVEVKYDGQTKVIQVRPLWVIVILIVLYLFVRKRNPSGQG